MALSAEELAALKTRRDALQTALDSLAMGKASAEVRYADFAQKFHPADMGVLERMISKLDLQIASGEGRRRGAIIIGF